MKKRLIFVLVLMSVFVFTSCASKKEEPKETEQKQEESDLDSAEDKDMAVNSMKLMESVSDDDSGVEPSLSAFKTLDIDGNEITQEIFQSADLTMVNIWATNCGYCLEEMPDFQEISQEYDSSELQVVGILMDVYNPAGTVSQSQLDLAREIMDKTGVTYLQLMPSKDLILAKLQEVSGVPETFFVDKEGNVLADYLGLQKKEKIVGVIDDLLEEVGE